ncbi:TPA: type VI secretion system contractile sheath large subunit [Escherichia coli]|nr:type VI secretion system contractile sheath large subunit [Escherichia coli]MCN8939485.1 type VI secretion system contractile sheath large subunit [Escherichia coli]GCV91543.1 type VI secretion protein [Escherichia coli]HAI6615269.1 type VI secretion system contractile sheath large subunit [Escherichia coli]HAJ7571659.1 type VI secretion system contractile sheath large subunit [Escherichia coli]HAL0521940.1 type VI secretion system contractile sheath large subunit [Escherichia coli]
MSVQQEHATSETATLTTTESGGVYQSLFDKINLTPVSSIQEIDLWQNSETLADASPDERVTAAIHVLLSCLAKSGEDVVKLDKSLLDFHIDDLDQKISKQLDAVMHHPEFQKVESLWRGTWFVVQRTDFRKNVRIELLDISKEHLRQDFDDSPEIIQSGLYRHTYIQEYDTPGGEPVASLISSYEFDNSPQDIALLRNISRVSAASHMPFIGSVGPKFFLKNSMEEVAAIKDIGNYFDRAEYIKWKSFRDTDDSRYVGLVMPRVLGRLPYGPDTVPVRSFNYVEEVKGPDHDKYLWTNASFAFAANMVKSFVNNGWCVQIRGPQAGGAVADLPIHLYDLGTGNQVKIPSEVMIPETREFEFANLGFIPLSYYKNRDYACFFSANSAQKPALYDTADATANSRINARLPYIFLLSRIAHYLKIIQRENIGTTKDRRVLELELNTWIRTLVPDVSLQYEPDGRSVIRLRFECGPLVGDWSQIDLSRLPLYLSADSPVACALHRALTLGTQQFWLRLPGQGRRVLDAHFSPMGFDDDDRLWPKGESAFSGYQLLLEYFTFREKFMFVALNGLEQVAWPEGITGFEIDVVLNENWPHDLPFDSDNIRLHCVPVINLFPLEADPLHLSPLENEFLLRPMRIQDGHTEIYSVDNIISSRHTGSQAYVPFSSFRHRGGMLRHDAPERYYHTRVKRGPSGLHDTWLILGGDAFDTDRMLEDETLSLSLTGTNGQLPRKALQSTLLDTPVHASQNVLRVRNLCAPTQPCYPPARDRFHWRVLSHLGSNFLSMMDNAEILRGTLALYDWTESEMNRRRLAAIVDVQHSLIQRFERGFLLRGVDIQVTLDSNGFAGEGDITLFGELLHRFFALYADIHLFTQLTLILQPTGKCLQWTEHHSQRVPG